jgi:TP901 family phage tail tape measure protein
MALSAHELILVLRARDEASRVLRNLEGNIAGLSRAQEAAARKQIAQGAALATVGVGIAAAGAAGLQFFGNAISTAQEYNRQVALTATQTDKVKVSMSQLSDIGLQVAKTIPVPFEEIQPMLYDIFSSMNVNTKQATTLLQSFSRAAVGGQVPLQEAGRATIAILNAYRLPAERVNEVNDFMFQLVRKGVGTYHEFSTTIGRSIPSAVRAGQTYQALGGMLAFLTRNGLSTAMATASAGRALDAISNPNTVTKLRDFGVIVGDALGKDEAIRRFGKNFKDMSINIKDANGNFLPMTDIMAKLSKVLIGLPPPERAAILHEVFKGSGGTIQARRFFDIAIPGIREFTQLTKDMYNNRGAAEQAYQIMLATPAMQARLLASRFAALRTEIGNDLLPIWQTLISVGNKMLAVWEAIPPSTRKIIVIVAAVTSAFLVVAGVVIAAAGAMLMMQGAAALAGTTVFAVVGPVLAVIAAVAALAAIFIYAYTHSETFRKAVNNIGTALMVAGKAIVSAVQTAFGWVVNTALPWLKNAWTGFSSWISNLWTTMVGWWNTASQAIQKITHTVWDPIITWLKGLLQGFQNWYALHAEQLHRVWEYLVNAWTAITKAFGQWILPFLQNVWSTLVSQTKLYWGPIQTTIRGAWTAIRAFLTSGFVWLKVAWNILWTLVNSTVKVAWSTVYNTLAIAWHLISGAFSVFLDLITGHWRTAWEDIKRMAVSIWGNLKAIFGTWAREALNVLKSVGSNLLEGLKNGVLNVMRGIGSWLYNNIVKPIIDHVKHFFGINSPSTVFAEIGGHMITGLIRGLMHDPKALVGKIFGGLPAALGAIVGKGIVAISQLPQKALEALGAVSGQIQSFAGGLPGGTPGKNVQIGRMMASAMGWGDGNNWASLFNLWMGESGWNNMARNPSSGAFGIPQSLPASKMGPAAVAGNAAAQIAWGLNYIKQVYGSPANAYAKWLSRSPHWYGIGTAAAQKGWAVVGDRGPELMYMQGGEGVLSNRDTNRVLAPNKQVTVNQTIYTNEINPRAHGAALAWEFATQVA